MYHVTHQNGAPTRRKECFFLGQFVQETDRTMIHLALIRAFLQPCSCNSLHALSTHLALTRAFLEPCSCNSRHALSTHLALTRAFLQPCSYNSRHTLSSGMAALIRVFLQPAATAAMNFHPPGDTHPPRPTLSADAVYRIAPK